MGQRAERLGNDVDIDQLCNICCGDAQAVALTVFPQLIHDGLEVGLVTAIELAPQFDLNCMMILELESRDRIQQLIQYDRVFPDPVTDFTGSPHQAHQLFQGEGVFSKQSQVSRAAAD